MIWPCSVLGSTSENKQQFVLICNDSNASVSNIIPNADFMYVGNCGIGPRTACGSLLTSFVQSEGLQTSNRLFQRDLANTYTFFHPTTGMRQIDFLICGSLLEVIDMRSCNHSTSNSSAWLC